VFWISYCLDRCPDEQLETVFEHLVAPNSVVKRGFLAFGEYIPHGRVLDATFIGLRVLFLLLQCTEIKPRAGARRQPVLAHFEVALF
jgi:hypothetical protein